MEEEEEEKRTDSNDPVLLTERREIRIEFPLVYISIDLGVTLTLNAYKSFLLTKQITLLNL